MIDMLVRLYSLPPAEPLIEAAAQRGVVVRRPRAYEKSLVVEWVRRQFSRGWADECEVCFSRAPVSAFIATHSGALVGFACHEATHRNFFGPIGVADEFREQGLGRCLLLASLHAMRGLGYAYAIVGGPSDAVSFYSQAAGAVPIEGSTPGIYLDRLQGSDS